jgi:hypothetical protein
MKKIITLLSITFVLIDFAKAQQLKNFNEQQNKITKIGMSTLGSWSLASIAWGITGYNNSNETYKYFSQMNVSWGIINVSLALPSYLKARKAGNLDYNFSKTYLEQTKVEKIFSVNTALDVAYITGGLLLKERAKWDISKQAQWNGFGNAIIMQGSFLFAFDLAMAAVHSHHRKKILDAKLPEQFE